MPYYAVFQEERTREAVKQLKDKLKVNAKILIRSVRTPAGTTDNAKLFWFPNLPLWVYIHEYSNQKSADPPKMIWIVAGTEDLTNLKTVTPNLEFNPPLHNHQRLDGLIVEDEEGSFYLARKAGLRGGKNNVSKNDFVALFTAASPEHVYWEGKESNGKYYILGDVEDPEISSKIYEFVSAANRIRDLKKNDVALFRQNVDNVISQPGTALSDEHDGVILINRPGGLREIKRCHAKVYKALKDELVKFGCKIANERLGSIAPDLYTLPRDKNRMHCLFEIKTSVDAQSVFTGIGQLMVYGAGQNPPPERILVIPGKPKDKRFELLLKQLGIRILQYSFSGPGKVHFINIDSILNDIRSSPC